MKIDDFIREGAVKPDGAIKVKVDVGSGPVPEIDRIPAGVASDVEFSMPDLLQAFGQVVSRRQQLMDVLPIAVRERMVENAKLAGGASDPFTSAGSSIQQGMSGLIRDNRALMETLRQIATEMRFVEQVPELTEIFSSTSGNIAGQATEGNRTGTSAIRPPSVLLIPEALQKVADEGLSALQKAIVQQNLSGETAGGRTAAGAALPVAVLSRAGRLENMLSLLGSSPEILNKTLSRIPEVLAAAQEVLPPWPEGKASAGAYEKLAGLAPKWLLSIAERDEMPELLEFWVDTKAADLAPWVKLGQTGRQQTITVLKELASTYEQPEVFRNQGEDSSSRGLMLQVPLYAPGQEKPYPALLHIFEEKKDRGNGQLPEQEVWVRVSLVTDHIGTVDLSFQLQDKKYLTIFSRFSNPEDASEFRAALPEIRTEIAATSLELKKIAVAQRDGTGEMDDG